MTHSDALSQFEATTLKTLNTRWAKRRIAEIEELMFCFTCQYTINALIAERDELEEKVYG